MEGLSFVTGKKEHSHVVHEFLLQHFRISEPITRSISATVEDVFTFFCDLRDGGLNNEKYSILAFDGEELVGICLNNMKEVETNKENEDPVPFDPHKDFGPDIEAGPYSTHNANKLVSFVENVETGLLHHLLTSEKTKKPLTKIFKVDVICVHPKMQGKGLGRELMKRAIDICLEAECSVLATCATAQASQALFSKFGFVTLREVPFYCFRERQVPVYQDLHDNGLSGKLMAKWL